MFALSFLVLFILESSLAPFCFVTHSWTTSPSHTDTEAYRVTHLRQNSSQPLLYLLNPGSPSLSISFLHLPLCAVSLALFFTFLTLRSPHLSSSSHSLVPLSLLACLSISPCCRQLLAPSSLKRHCELEWTSIAYSCCTEACRDRRDVAW